MEYNTKRAPLVMREYGRNVQNIVNYMLSLEDKEQQKDMAFSLVELMAQLNPGIKQLDDWKHKLWDHLHIIADYQLDVEGPYPKPDREEVETRPARMAYPRSKFRHKHYGKHVEALMQKAMETEDPEKKAEFTKHIGAFMKMAYQNWNQDNVGDALIKKDLAEMSGGELALEEVHNIKALDHGMAKTPANKSGGKGRNRKGRNRKRGGGGGGGGRRRRR